MANAIVYVDNVNGNNANSGLSEASAYADIPTAIAAISGGGNVIYVQNAGSNYTLTSSISLSAALKGDTTNGRNRIEGYTTSPGARDGRPVITSATNSVNLFTLNDNDYWEFRHLKLTHTAGTRASAFNGGTSNSTPIYVVDCICDGCLALFTGGNLQAIILEGVEVLNASSSVSAINNTTASFNTLTMFGCDIHDNSCDGLRSNQALTLNCDWCIFDTNTIGINYTGTTTNVTIKLRNCLIVDNTGDGVKVAATSGTVIVWELANNIIFNNGGYGIENLDEQVTADLNATINRNNAFGGPNTSGNYTGLAAGYGEITLSGDPFANKASRDFTPDTTSGEGLALRAAAFPTTYPGGTSPSYRDVGAVQHQDAGGAAGPLPPGTFVRSGYPG